MRPWEPRLALPFEGAFRLRYVVHCRSTRTFKEDAMNKLRVYLSFSLIGLLLCGIAQAQVPTSSNDTDRANALLRRFSTQACRMASPPRMQIKSTPTS